jgi:hypothetical protein
MMNSMKRCDISPSDCVLVWTSAMVYLCFAFGLSGGRTIASTYGWF